MKDAEKAAFRDKLHFSLKELHNNEISNLFNDDPPLKEQAEEAARGKKFNFIK